MKYSKQETIDKLNIELAKIESLYKANCLNWSGTTSDSNEQYTEVIAHNLLSNLKEFDRIAQVTRNSSYFRDSHCNISIDVCLSNRNEENFAKRITGLELDNLGLIKDFQIPLKDTLGDTGIGKIDLISFKNDVHTLYLIELKYIGNKETLLRALLESYTYYKIVDKKKLIGDCSNNQRFVLNKYFKSDNDDKIVIKPAVLLVPGCRAYDELSEMEMSQRPMLKALALSLGVSFFTLEFLVNEVML